MAGPQTVTAKDRLRGKVDAWKRIRERIREANEILEQFDYDKGSTQYIEAKAELEDLQARRGELVDEVRRIVGNHPNLYDNAENMGFRMDLLPAPSGGESRAETQHGVGDTNRAEDQHGADGRNENSPPDQDPDPKPDQKPDQKPDYSDQAVDNRLPGDKGKHYDLVQGPKGSFVIRQVWRVRGEVIKTGLRVKRSQLARYGFKPADARRLSAAQMKQIKNIGWADELAPHIRKGDAHVLKALVRSLGHQYGGQAILEDDEVMSVIIANSLFGWKPGEFENELRNTKWYRNTNDYQRQWVTVTSPKQKRDTVRQFTERVIDQLEDYYGLNWVKHVDGGMGKAKEWATKIASGQWGSPDAGFAFWASRQFDKAAEIEGTPAAIQRESEEEERRARLNRPEDMYETLRAQADQWLGERFRPDRATLMKWAESLVSEKKSDHDWMTFLRRQTKALHPWKNDDTPWQDLASSFQGIAEDIMRKPLDLNDRLFANLGNEKGTAPLSAHEFELMVRQDNRAWKEGSRLWDEGTAIGMQLANMMQGVTFG